MPKITWLRSFPFFRKHWTKMCAGRYKQLGVSIYFHAFCYLNSRCSSTSGEIWNKSICYSFAGAESRFTLNDLLVFATGLECIPPGGYGDHHPTITSSNTIVAPESRVCFNELTIPSCEIFEDFCNRMNEGLQLRDRFDRA